jgi:hypothetical protein
MEPELAHVASEEGGHGDRTDIRYLEQALHRTPDTLRMRLQQEIDQAGRSAARIVLGYGLCAKGITGSEARPSELIIPRCHDCIALFLGSPDGYLELFRKRPGTYFLTPGWIAEKKDPLGVMEEYVPRFGRETSRWVMEEELKHYTHIALIDTGVQETGPLRARAMENAAVLNKEYAEIRGSLTYFRKLLRGPYGEEMFLRLGPDERFTPEMVA